MIIKIFEIVSVLSSLFRFNSFRYFLLRIICLIVLSIQLKRLTAGTHLWRTRRKRRSRVMSDSYDSWDPQRDDLCWTADLIYQTKDQFIWLFQSLNWADFSNKKGSMWFHMERALTWKEGKNQGRHDQEGRNYWIAYRKMSGRNMSKRRSWKEL